MLAISSVRFLVYCEIQEVNGVFELATSKTQFTSINVSDKVKKIELRAAEVFIHKVPLRDEANFRCPVLKLHSLPLFLQIALIVPVAASCRNNSWSISVSRNSAPGILRKAKICDRTSSNISYWQCNLHQDPGLTECGVLPKTEKRGIGCRSQQLLHLVPLHLKVSLF